TERFCQCDAVKDDARPCGLRSSRLAGIHYEGFVRAPAERRIDVMHQMDRQPGGATGPLEAIKKIIPFEADAASDRLGWAGLEAARYRAAPDSELVPLALSHHWLVLFVRSPKQLELQYDCVKRHVPPPAGAISVVPAGTPTLWR